LISNEYSESMRRKYSDESNENEPSTGSFRNLKNRDRVSCLTNFDQDKDDVSPMQRSNLVSSRHCGTDAKLKTEIDRDLDGL
jgi:hypothetical protein